MKTLMCGLAMSFGISAASVNAEQMLNIDGTDQPLSGLMASCQSITDDPAAQIACFSEISRLLEEQSGGTQQQVLSVPEALDALKTAAQYQDQESGLLISGSDCNIQVTYFNNYFHLSRRNISTIDLFSAQLDASNLSYDQITVKQGAAAPLLGGVMSDGATAITRGGLALDSAQSGFAPRSPQMSIDAYANEIVPQLNVVEGQAFEFVLVHPQKSQSGPDIMSAFEDFINACNA